MNALEVDGVRHAYAPGTPSLDGVSLAIAQGALVCLLGPSGCGKTTLLQLVAGHLAPTAGRVLLGGRELTRARPEHRDIGMVFQHYALFPHLSVLDNVAFGLEARGVPIDERRRRAAEALAQVGLDPTLAARRPLSLSGGQQQRVAVARALVIKPRLLLLDEPFANLDRPLRRQLRDELRLLHEADGTTTVLVTHDQEEALAIADQIALLDRGRLLACDSPRALYARPRTRAIALQLGDANLLPILAVEGDLLRLAGGLQLVRPGHTATVGQEVLLRPEWITLGESTVRATIRTARFDGADQLLEVALPDGLSLRVRSRDAARSRGESVTLSVSSEQAWILPGA